jgi:hypothetical protein
MSIVLAFALIVAATIFTYVNVKAYGRVEYSKAECIELAKKSVYDHSNVISTSLIIIDVDRDTRFKDGKLSNAVYVYEIDVRKGSVEYEVMVNSATGEAIIIDVDD